jgi:nitrate reductase NapAB chaperone NapD
VPIKSYLAYSVTGRRDALARALAALGGCEVIPASNRDVLVLVTDTADESAERILQTTLEACPTSRASRW